MTAYICKSCGKTQYSSSDTDKPCECGGEVRKVKQGVGKIIVRVEPPSNFDEGERE